MAELEDVNPADWKASRQINRSNICSKPLHFRRFISLFPNAQDRFTKGRRGVMWWTTPRRGGAGLLWGCTSADPEMPALLCPDQCSSNYHPAELPASNEPAPGLLYGPLPASAQALCDVFCSPHLLQVLPFPQQRWASGKSREERRKAGEISTCCNSLWKWAKR